MHRGEGWIAVELSRLPGALKEEGHDEYAETRWPQVGENQISVAGPGEVPFTKYSLETSSFLPLCVSVSLCPGTHEWASMSVTVRNFMLLKGEGSAAD